MAVSKELKDALAKQVAKSIPELSHLTGDDIVDLSDHPASIGLIDDTIEFGMCNDPKIIERIKRHEEELDIDNHCTNL